MANLLYVERGIGCYVGWKSSGGDYDYGVYCYGYGANRASYYADLQPNTTYTIQRIDTSTIFRIALTSTDVKYYTASSDTWADVFSWGYKADSSNPVTFTTGDTNTHLVVYYTYTSEYNTRVMLNEGSSIEPYEAPTRTFRSWSLVDDILIHDELPEPIDEALSEPYPASLWRLDSDDILTLNNEDWTPFPEPMEYLTPPYPATMWYLDEDNKLMNALFPDELLSDFGCFRHATNLKIVSIPLSVTSIDTHSFSDTSLKRAHLADNCTYYNTSFPENCEVSGGQLIEEGD